MDNKILMRSCNGISTVSTDARLAADRVLFIKGDITTELMCNLYEKLMVLVRENPCEPVTMLLSSPGGCIADGLAIYDLIQTCKTPIRMIAIGQVSSMAAVLFASGRHGRYLTQNSVLLLHEPSIKCNVTGGNFTTIQSVAEGLREQKEKIKALLVAATGKQEEEIEQAIGGGIDHFLTAQEAIELGLADKIIGFDQIMEVCYGD